jgi:hypothetical protein
MIGKLAQSVLVPGSRGFYCSRRRCCPAASRPWAGRYEGNPREQNQQDPIANGVKNGTMTPGQAARVERREQHTDSQEKRDMAAHNGHLTKAETKPLNKEQNHTSREIYRDKHK